MEAMLRARFIAAFFALLIGAGVRSAQSAAILSFQPDTTTSPAEIDFGVNGSSPAQPPSFTAGAGSVGNGDGGALSGAVSPGLTIVTPLKIAPGILGEQVNSDGSTTFYDVTLQFTGLTANAPAQPIVIPFSPVFLVQTLGPGTFVFSASKVGGGAGVPLLSGTIVVNAELTGSTGSSAGSEITSSDVTYTGGAIYNALLLAGGSPTLGSESISLLSVSPTLSIDPTTTYVSDFNANATGQFSVTLIPEPACLGVLAATVVCLTGRYRRQSPPFRKPAGN
jgi:hypothetical protein